jgi:hypothetical protein
VAVVTSGGDHDAVDGAEPAPAIIAPGGALRVQAVEGSHGRVAALAPAPGGPARCYDVVVVPVRGRRGRRHTLTWLRSGGVGPALFSLAAGSVKTKTHKGIAVHSPRAARSRPVLGVFDMSGSAASSTPARISLSGGPMLARRHLRRVRGPRTGSRSDGSVSGMC